MSSQPESETPRSILERLINSRNRDLSLLIPFILGFTSTFTDPDETRVDSGETRRDSGDDSGTRSSTRPDESGRRERVVLFNSVTQGMVVMEGVGLDSLFHGVQGKGGQPPASKSSVEAMPRVEIVEGEDKGECAICLDEYNVGNFVKKMPCDHAFHEGCIEKWLGIHGSCPVCRYKMPVDQEESTKSEDGDRATEEIWVRISFGRRRARDGDAAAGGDGNGNGDGDGESEEGDQSERGDRTVENEEE